MRALDAREAHLQGLTVGCAAGLHGSLQPDLRHFSRFMVDGEPKTLERLGEPFWALNSLCPLLAFSMRLLSPVPLLRESWGTYKGPCVLKDKHNEQGEKWQGQRHTEK